MRRVTAPEAPWWYATALSPYSAKRGAPIAIDYLELRASCPERVEVTVAERVVDEIQRSIAKIAAPALVDASEFAEVVFRRGEEAAKTLEAAAIPAMLLISTRGELPLERSGATIILSTWPLDFDRIEQLAAAARGKPWGMAVPVIFPVTTSLDALRQLSEISRDNGAMFFAAIPVETDSTARGAIAQSLSSDDDEETYSMLFHADLEPVHVATERHIAALASEAGLADFVVPPGWAEKSNWNAAVLLTLTATRMMAMDEDVELAGTLARSARRVAEMEKPLARIAETASLSIVETLDKVSAGILTEWLSGGTSAWVESVNSRWRLRRDAGL